MPINFALRKPRYSQAISGDVYAPEIQPSENQIPEETRYSPAIAGTMPPPPAPYSSAISGDAGQLREMYENPPQLQRKPLGVGGGLAAALLGRGYADAHNGVNDYKDAMMNYQARTQGLQGAMGIERQGMADTRQSSVDDLNRRNIESEISSRRPPLGNVVGSYSDALSRNDLPEIGRLRPLVQQFEEDTDKSNPPAPKPAKEQIQMQIRDEMGKPSPDKKVISGLQNQLRAIDPMGQQRIGISIEGMNNRKEQAEQKISRDDVRQHDKDYVVPAEAVEKSYQMMQHAYDEYKSAKAQGKDLPTGAQSMLALSTHLSTTFGNVKGARVTKDMIQHHLGARSISDSALVAIQKLTNGDVLSPDQWDAFHDLIGQSRNLSWQTATKEAKRKNIPVDFLPPDVSEQGTGTAPMQNGGSSRGNDPLGIR